MQVGLEIRDVCNLLCARKPTKTSIRVWSYRAVQLPECAICWRDIVQMCGVKTFTIVEQDMPELGLANTQRAREHGFKDKLQVTRRRANYL